MLEYILTLLNLSFKLCSSKMRPIKRSFLALNCNKIRFYFLPYPKLLAMRAAESLNLSLTVRRHLAGTGDGGAKSARARGQPPVSRPGASSVQTFTAGSHNRTPGDDFRAAVSLRPLPIRYLGPIVMKLLQSAEFTMQEARNQAMDDRLSATDVQALITAAGEALWGSRWQAEMARALSVHRDTVHDWKTGVSTPRVNVLDKLRELLAERRVEIASVLERLDLSNRQRSRHEEHPRSHRRPPRRKPRPHGHEP
ncbi:hypothetical protein [Microvirga pudoricolor]|uniref:hypothetical protein n=1 Tax=Microvirga pudoricolor TaxID=2778729 RepID=UPI001952893B|nr:hypothetical protein [Microvirga pudoricolor]MBM6595413.1 hypothetical protein [Microvirga pudoricolor]